MVTSNPNTSSDQVYLLGRLVGTWWLNGAGYNNTKQAW